MTGSDVKPDNETSTSRPGHVAGKGQGDAKAERDATSTSPTLTASRIPTGKNARIVELVSRAEGAGIGELTSVTGWQRHTVRAALTRLRQAGFAIELRTAEDGRRTHHLASAEASS
jgi:predicted transcriptional regulator